MAQITNGAAILIGGKSSRMGSPKPLIEIDGRTLLELCVEAAMYAASPVILVGDAAGLPVPYDCRFVADRYPGAGPVGGIATALAELGPGAHLILACDMPFLNIDLLKLLLKSIGEEDDAAVPWLESGPEPLCAVYSHACLPRLETLLREGRRSARGALDVLRVKRVEENDLRAIDPNLRSFVNINTPEELERCRATTGRGANQKLEY
jgi:molybdenum cofactor guanylyltransferase